MNPVQTRRRRGCMVTFALIASAALTGCQDADIEAGTAQASPRRMAAAADQFLSALSSEQRDAAQFPFDADVERGRWSNLPASMVERSGVRVGDLTNPQRRRLHDLLRASTSSQGYQKIAGVIRLDEVLHEEASAAIASGIRRFPARLVESWTSANYWISFFGQPGDHDPGNDYGEDWLGKHYEEHHQRR